MAKGTHEPNSDLSYNFDTTEESSDEPQTTDPDAENVSVLEVVSRDIVKMIKEHNTFDVINPKGSLSVEQQMAAHKVLVTYLRQFKTYIDGKIEELS